MSFQIPTAFVQQYRPMLERLVQQGGSRLRGNVRIETQVGVNEYFDRVGAVTARKVTTRHDDSPLISTPHDRRRVSILDYDWGDLIDTQDKLRLLLDPTSTYSENARDAFGRAIDDEIIGAAFGTAFTGVDGSTQVTFPAGNQVAVNFKIGGGGSNSSLILDKILEAKRLMDLKEVPADGRFIVASSKEFQNLLNTTTVLSSDYNTVRALASGQPGTLYGFEMIRSERLLVNGSAQNRVIAYQRDGLLLSMAQDISVEIAPRPDKRFAPYIYVCMTLGATRMEEERVIELVCA